MGPKVMMEVKMDLTTAELIIRCLKAGKVVEDP